MSENKGAAARESVNLARIEPFRLGALEVCPATRQLKRGERGETLEPRVMQVLVALRQADAAVVTRDDLIARCWGGRIVGDNAIHRTISRLRDIAASIGDGCFRLETVSKVGYRLIPLKPSAAMSELPAASAPPLLRRKPLVVMAAIGASAIVAVLIAWARLPIPDSTTIAIVAAPGQDSVDLADGLAVDLERLSNEHGAGIVPARGSERPRTDYVLTVTERRQRGAAHADVALGRSGSPDLLWSTPIAGDGGDAAILRQRAASLVSRVTACASHIVGDPVHDSSATLRLIFSACERRDEEADNLDVTLWRRIVAREPGNAAALAALAFAEAQWADVAYAQNALQATGIAELRSAARGHLNKARSLDGHLGMTYAAEAFLLAPSRYGDRLSVIESGLIGDPDCARLHAMKVEALQNTGRMDDSIASARKAVELEPSSSSWHAQLAWTLADTGYTKAANDELQAGERIWPDSRALEEARSHFELRFGNAAALIRKIDRGGVLPNTPAELTNGLARAFLLARADSTSENVSEAVRLSFQQPASWYALQNLVALGQVDEAYAFVNDPARTSEFRRNGAASTYTLFRVYMRRFRLDGRFMPLADRLGLVPYWLATGIWPDFCADRDLPYNCRAEARRLHPKTT